MNVMEAVMTRRNVKSFKQDPIDRSQVEAWLQAAAMAPNHRMTEPWEIVFLGPDIREKINHKNNFGHAPLVFAVLSAPGKNQLERDENVEAVACFIQNFLLLAHAEGVGTGWSSIGASPRVHELLGAAEGQEVIGILPVGYPTELPDAKPRTDIKAKIRELA